MPALGDESRDDRLVHLCRGAPGHVLLLVKAYEVYDDLTLLERAEEIARGVICRRGLLRKGIVPVFWYTCMTFFSRECKSRRAQDLTVFSFLLFVASDESGLGLCHGISGNAYCFLSLYRGRRIWERRRRGSTIGGGTLSDEAVEWLRWAHNFARFGLDNANELYQVPDHPYSLYEGISGFVLLLHDLRDPDNSRFPCFEP